MKEPIGYRQTLEYLSSKTDKAWLTTSDVAKILGVDRHTVTRRFGINSGCALPVLAMKLTQENK